MLAKCGLCYQVIPAAFTLLVFHPQITMPVTFYSLVSSAKIMPSICDMRMFGICLLLYSPVTANLFIANYPPSLCSVSHCEDMSGPLLRNMYCSILLRSSIHDTRSVSDFGYFYRLTS